MDPETLELWPMAALVAADGRVRAHNARAEGLFGRGDLRGRPLVELMDAPPADGASADTTAHGAEAPFVASVLAQALPDGARLLVVEDVTQARLHVERLEHAVSLHRIGIYDHDHASDEIWCSPLMREMYGFEPDEPVTLDGFVQRLPPDQTVMAAVARAHDPTGDGAFDVEHRVVQPSGALRWVHSLARTTFAEGADGAPRPGRTLGATVDLTEVKTTRDARQRLLAILDETPDLVAVAHRDGRALYLNQAGRVFFGLGAGASLEDYALGGALPEAARGRLADEILPAAKRDRMWRGELEFQDGDGKLRPVSAVFLAHTGRDAEPDFYSVVARDLTREVELEAQLRHAQRMEAVGRLAAGIAHDFNNLLSVILGGASLCLEELPGDGPVQEELREVRQAAVRAGELTRQLLAFGRRGAARLEVTTLDAIVEGLTPMLRRLIGEDIRVDTRLGAAAGHVQVDPGQLEQVLVNLSVNARDAMPRGGRLRIETQLVDVDEPYAEAHLDMRPGRHAALVVSDDGEGMDAETRAHIFDPFFTTKPVGRGTGLGLAMVYGTVKQVGGSIWVYSEVGRGTTFKIFIPTTEQPLGREAPPLRAPRPTSRAARILLVEDEPQVRQLVRTVLKRAGYVVSAASHAQEALDLARAPDAAFDLLITDVVMPGQSGPDLVAALRAAGHTMQVLFTSGYTEHALLDDGVPTGGARFLPKPFTPQDLLRAAADALGGAD